MKKIGEKMIKIQTKEEFQQYQQQDAVYMFSANWCPDCVVIEPHLKAIEEAFTQYTFVYVDRDLFIDECIELEITGIPSFIVFKEGQIAGRFVSKFRKSKEEIIKFLSEV